MSEQFSFVQLQNAEYPSFRYRATKVFQIFEFLALTRLSCHPFPLFTVIWPADSQKRKIPFLLLPWFLPFVHPSVVRGRVINHVLESSLERMVG